jgi:hypothetical protein
LVAQVKKQTADKAIAGDILMAGNQPLNGRIPTIEQSNSSHNN